ncbi:MAG: hypothetical protein P8126_06250 [Gammaproteobacteria bacterium]
MKKRLQSLGVTIPSSLINEVASQSSRIIPSDFSLFVEELKNRFGASLEAVILYGSCLRSRNPADGVVDLYAVVDDYRHAYSSAGLRRLNAWLPPNVFYMEMKREDVTLRTKYAVISMADFETGIFNWFHSYLWARFAQPVRIIFARDESQRDHMHYLLAAAVIRFLGEGIATLGFCEADAETIWTKSLSLAYAAELRPEKENRARQLTHLNLGDFTRLTACVAPSISGMLELLPHGYYRCRVSPSEQRRALRRWRLRRWQGRALSVLRLSKAVFTFKNCLDYGANTKSVVQHFS